MTYSTHDVYWHGVHAERVTNSQTRLWQPLTKQSEGRQKLLRTRATFSRKSLPSHNTLQNLNWAQIGRSSIAEIHLSLARAAKSLRGALLTVCALGQAACRVNNRGDLIDDKSPWHAGTHQRLASKISVTEAPSLVTCTDTGAVGGSADT